VKTFFKELLVIVLSALVIFLLVQIFFVGRAVVVGSSMEPNLHNDQRILVNKVAYAFSEPKRGDIIVFTPPHSPSSDNDLIKRIIGLPGETVEMKDGVVYIHQSDGTVLTLDEHEYIDSPSMSYSISSEIPLDNFFVLGDNRNNSSDSRSGWTVSRDAIHGKAWFSIWPISEWGSLLNFDYALP
jgi:signal peptidase I